MVCVVVVLGEDQCFWFFFFFFKQKTAYEMQRGLVGSEMCIRDSTKCFTRTHQIPTCSNCSSEMNMMACPVCEAEELKRPMDQHIFLFCQDMILTCEVKTNEAYWSYINFVDACPQVDFCYFPCTLR
eukprot:TRINITY_DN45004_c0_g1_i3.p1 TRINITY_DN45004_c0_g1~~TRINITY_DN45004_c0_g1_i3.p1  ORF type:complete len:127 (+),score=25.94 TRINITY_DN45004_c0_g1_i3:77-457(+)